MPPEFGILWYHGAAHAVHGDPRREQVGIVIRMFFDEHNPPHIHAEYQDHKAVFDLLGNIDRGDLESAHGHEIG